MKTFSVKVLRSLNWFIINGDEFVRKMSNNSANRCDLERYANVKRTLEEAIRIHSPLSATVHFYGSRVIGTSLGSSDLDFFIQVDDGRSSKISLGRQKELLACIKDALNDSVHWRVIKFIPDWSLPLLKVEYLRTNFECDITISSGSCVSLSNMLSHLNQIQPEFLRLFHFIRKWLHITKTSVKRYIQHLLLLFYLQQQNYMPTIECIQMKLQKKYIDDYEVQYDPTLRKRDYDVKFIKCYKDHILGYFKFYSKQVNFQQDILNVYTGHFMDRATYKSRNPEFMSRALCIVGPFNHSELSGKLPAQSTVEKFQDVCKLSYELLIQSGWK